ncbi:hypothetical protein FGIG_03488 [Fasciola gigantica]|uniref:Ig-like domain-containing protein n=1 Tax=Fasciola gigantica TaxID=46835 RepID=A0A504YX54_FASGI|nr:hypothetical protein FGIG_03488 [Fasciola gigantica]
MKRDPIRSNTFRWIFFLFILLSLEGIDDTLAGVSKCLTTVRKRSVANSTCARVRKELAIKRHHITLLGPQQPHPRVVLHCPICFESKVKDFVWKFIPRSANAPIFIESKQSIYESSWVLNERELKEVIALTTENPCVYPKSNDLRLSITNEARQIGTYVCQNVKEKNHPANFIWYHVDQFTSRETDLGRVSLGFLSGIPNRVDSLEQLKTIQTRVRRELERTKVVRDQEVGPFMMTSIYSSEDAYLDRCGPLTIRQERRCYMRIPVKEPPIFQDDFHYFIYKPLRATFNFLVSFRKSEGLERSYSLQTAQMRARQLGFQIHNNDSYLYIPCEFSLFRHFFQFPPMFREFPRVGHHVDVHYDVICPQMKALDLVNMKMTSTLRNLTFNLSDMKDLRYTKVERLIMQGERDLSLKCTTSRDRPPRCDGSYHDDVLWRSGNGLTFNKNRTPENNVYIKQDCSLHFVEFHIYDVDIYYCFLRDPTETHVVWSRQPRMAYRLHVEHRKFDWPNRNDVLTGLMILMILSVLLSVEWTALIFYDASAREGALFAATVKHAGGRLARLKKAYSPFSDEDRGLFFMIMKNDSRFKKI